MNAATQQIGIETWVSRRAMLVTGIVAWTGGLVLAIAAEGYMVHHAASAQRNRDNAAIVAPESTDTATDTVDSQGTTTIVMPDAVLVAPPPRDGVTSRQKP